MKTKVRGWICSIVMVAFLSLLGAGCQTTPKKEGSSNLVPPARISFQPSIRQVSVQAGEGRYPNLFTGASYAIWGDNTDSPKSNTMNEDSAMEKGGSEFSADSMMPLYRKKKPVPETTPPKEGADGDHSGPTMMEGGEEAESSTNKSMMAAANTAGQPIVIQCYLESQFPDMSIAYDAVGLRRIQFALKLPDGTEILPVQKVLNPDLVEEPVGALKRFGRKITLYFPSRTIMVDNPAVAPNSPGIRLILSGQESTFFFEWPAMPNTMATAKRPHKGQHVLKKTKMAYRDVARRAKRISHEFD